MNTTTTAPSTQSEPPLAPGDKTSTITFRNVSAEIRTVGDVEIDETKHANESPLRRQDAHLAATQQYAQAARDAKLLTEYCDGLVLKSNAAHRATMTIYAANSSRFIDVVLSFTVLLTLKVDFANSLAGHARALTHLDSLRGATLR